MTNKPMLSVELRKALADFIEYSVPGPSSDDAMWHADKQALRALLDKPASPQAWERDMDYRPEELGSPETEPACRTCNDTKMVDDGDLTHSAGGILYECGPIKCVKDCPDCKPAAQYQGEPVAEVEREFDNAPAHVHLYQDLPDGTKLYAEQPAPVAVVMPFAEKVIGKLQRFYECAEDSQGADIGRHWFDLLTQLGLLNRVQRSPALWEITDQGEEVLETARLNGVKP